MVTADEYNRAFDRFVECVTRSGAEPATARTTDRFGRISQGFKVVGEDGRQLQASTEDCRRNELDAVEFAWIGAHPPTAEDNAATREATIRCLAEAGVIVSSADASTLHEFIKTTLTERVTSQLDILGSCLTRTAEQFNWPGYAGS